MVIPLCPIFGSCGGCQSQHIDYALQLENKKQGVIDALDRAGIEIPDEVPVFSDEPYHYRNRLDLVFSKEGPGLRQKGSKNKIIPVKDCPIASERINRLLKELWQWWESRPGVTTFHPDKKRGCLRYVVFRATKTTNSISFVLNEDDKELEKHYEVLRSFAATTSAKNVLVALVPKNTDRSTSPDCFAIKGTEILSETLAGQDLAFHSQGFFQNNSVMAEKMIQFCQDLLRRPHPSTLVDLYGGCGTFGFTLKDLFEKTIIIDHESHNIDCAKEKADALLGIQAIAADAGSIFAKIAEEKELVLLVDPPRSGMHHKVQKRIQALLPEFIIYISCNPKQMARELVGFKARYRLTDLGVFDLFPQTNHVEAIAFLKKQKRVQDPSSVTKPSK